MPTSSTGPRPRFNWPPTDDDLAEYRDELVQRSTDVEDAGIQEDPLAVDVSPGTDAIALFPSEAPPRTILPQPEQTRTRPALSPRPSTPGDSVQARSGGEELEHCRTEDRSTSATAVSPSAAGRDLPGSADLVDEIAHLQALIEGLTQKIEWRIPTVSRR